MIADLVPWVVAVAIGAWAGAQRGTRVERERVLRWVDRYREFKQIEDTPYIKLRGEIVFGNDPPRE